MNLLEVSDIRVGYGNIVALKSVSFSVPAGSLVTLIGGNGAGKSTTLRTISGLLRAVNGEIDFDGQSISAMAAERIVRLGVAHVPEGRRIFARMTVLENLELGAFSRGHKRGGDRADSQDRADSFRDDLAKIFERFPILKDRQRQVAGTLSGGEQQMLAIGRALMGRPRLLMLDEPSMGLSPIMMGRIFDTLAELKGHGITILLVEQNAQAALKLADLAYVMETGTIVLQGTGEELLAHPGVRQAYLGSS